MADYEKLGVFYLGKYHDLTARKSLPDPVLYNSSDLLTHALCVGMTGSGKTGLCVALVEEAAIDNIPVLLIDPKGDLANLLLTFPDLKPEDFQPWVNEDDARKKGLSTAEFAAQQAQKWREGLAQWNQDGERIRRLRASADFAIYTPGSNAGLPLSILSSFTVPPPAVLDDPEQLRDRVNATVASLLGLIGYDADAVRNREAVFLANVFQRAWQEGRDLDLGALVHEIQSPSIQRVGVMDVETFYPAKDRFALATAINGLLASPGFGAWLEGEPLDIQRLLFTAAGKPRVTILSIAHLSDAERMFFVTLLLNQMLGWMRSQSGTTSLRAILYMDEIFGFFPPVANPPSKTPLLTLLKQARAFGVGLVLATQNPVDLDYKGLANIGTWFLGRLQTDRDKQRVLDGLEGAASSQGTGFDRAAMEGVLASLGSRIFLLHNVHESGDAIFESRWVMSYLRGPLARNQIKTLMDARRAPTAAARPSTAPAAARLSAAPASARIGSTPASSPPSPSAAAAPIAAEEPVPTTPATKVESGRPTLPPAIAQFYVPAGPGTSVDRYEPRLLGVAQIRLIDSKTKVDANETIVLLTAIHDAAVPVDWSEAEPCELNPNHLQKAPAQGARFDALPAPACQPKNYDKWSKDFATTLATTWKVTLLRSQRMGQVSHVGETEGDFRARLQLSARELRDAAAAKLRAKYAPKIATLQERLRRAEQAVEREKAQARSATLSSVMSFGSTLLGAFLGKKAITATNVGKASTAIKSVGRTVEQSQDVGRAQETVASLSEQLTELDLQFKAEVEAAENLADPANEVFTTLELRPAKGDISVRLVALAWRPQST